MKAIRPGLVSIVLLAGVISSGGAHAFPLPKLGEVPLDAKPEIARDLLGKVDFSGIATTVICSASLVRFDASLPTDRAMALTNGHCLGEDEFMRPGEVRVGQPASMGFTLLKADGSLSRTVRSDQVMYATMTGTDLALYRLAKTYAQLEAELGAGAKPLTMSSKRPVEGRPIAIASGYWRRIYSCTIDYFVHELREDGYSFKDSVLYKQPGCATIGGTSGSPIIDTATLEVVGVNNTGNDDGEQCTMSNPCEVDRDGNIIAERGRNYGQQTYWVYSCLAADLTIDLSKPGCLLPR